MSTINTGFVQSPFTMVFILLVFLVFKNLCCRSFALSFEFVSFASLLRFGLRFKYGADKKALRCRFEVYHGSAQAHRAVCQCHARDNFVNLRCSCWEETLLQMRAFAEGVKLRDVLFFLLLLFFPANALIVANSLCCWMFWSCFVL